jgi:hypothetical protein
LYPYLLFFLGDLVSGIMEDSKLFFWLDLAVSYVYRNRIRISFMLMYYLKISYVWNFWNNKKLDFNDKNELKG